MNKDELQKIEDELCELMGSEHQSSFDAEDLANARRIYVGWITGKSKLSRPGSDVTITVIIIGIVFGIGGCVVKAKELILLGVITTVVASGILFKIHSGKDQGREITTNDRLDSLKRIYEKQVISLEEYQSAVNYLVDQTAGKLAS